MIATGLQVPSYFSQFSDSKSETSTQGDEGHCENHQNDFPCGFNSRFEQKTVKSKIKSSLCRNFTETGFCPYGQKCQFAHGTNQLLINYQNTNNSYKTKCCNAFLKKGYCQYGYRCNFVHKQVKNTNNTLKSKWEDIYKNNRQVLNECKVVTNSRLMQILKD